MPDARIRTVHIPWSPGYQPTWPVAQVRGALNAHERGDFVSSSKLITAMGRDDRVSATTGTRINALLGRDFRLRPADEESAPDVALAEAMESDWWDMVPEAELEQLVKWYLFAGGGLGELRWVTDSSFWMPRLHVWDLQHLQWDELADGDSEGRLRLQTRAGSVEVTPGDGKWVLLAKGQRWWQNGCVRSLALPWLIRQFAIRDWARHSERLGLPIVKAMVPSAASETDAATFFDDVRTLSNETTVMLPQGDTPGESFDLDLLEATAQNWEGIKGLVDQMSDIIGVRMLGHNLTTEVRGGSFAASQTGNDVRQDYLRDDAQTLTTCLRQGIAEPVRSYNFASTTAKQTPWPEYDIEPAADLAAKAAGLKAFGEALTAIEDSGNDVDNIDEIAQEYGLQLTKREKPEPPPMPPQFGVPPAPPVADPEQEAKMSSVRLASGDDPRTVPGFVEGQAYIDSIGDAGTEAGKRALAPDLKAILSAISDATSYPDMRERLKMAFGEMDPDDFARLVEKGLVLADLAGQEAVLRDL